MKKILLLIFTVVLTFSCFSFEKKNLIQDGQERKWFFFESRKEFENSLPSILQSEHIAFPIDNNWLNSGYGEVYKASKTKLIAKYSPNAVKGQFGIELAKNPVAVMFVHKENTLVFGITELKNDCLYQTIFILSKDLNKTTVKDDYIPVQKHNKSRQETDKNISFMSFTADSTVNDVISYLKKLGFDYQVITHWTRGGGVEYETYRIEDINYNDCDFNYIDIDIEPKDGYLRKYDVLLKIYCVCLTDKDFLRYEKFLKENYNFSDKDQLYYGKSRFYSTKLMNKFNYEYEGENSGYIYYDEIKVDSQKKSVSYNFTVKHDYIIPVKNIADYIPFETVEEIEKACKEFDGKYTSLKSIPSKKGDRFMLGYCKYITVNNEEVLQTVFRNCSTNEFVDLSAQEAFDLLILDGHPFGKKKEK